ncbi:hypothetical protein [Roseomonas populi]|uniref:Uncharacterized protein n=1 Tax=Roseomonas populi TaxID=3121582 RepID=A0ABT1X3A9_9PROT|nr:hypothetical protein [Roseomonas pecuniae]MCR0981888.1 hypothetical protein [Roseomonas pecuniae]
MGRMLWRMKGGPQMVADGECGLRLSVTSTEAPASIRFVVEECGDGRQALPLISGYRDEVGAAMEAAEEAAARIAGRRGAGRH